MGFRKASKPANSKVARKAASPPVANPSSMRSIFALAGSLTAFVIPSKRSRILRNCAFSSARRLFLIQSNHSRDRSDRLGSDGFWRGGRRICYGGRGLKRPCSCFGGAGFRIESLALRSQAGCPCHFACGGGVGDRNVPPPFASCGVTGEGWVVLFWWGDDKSGAAVACGV